MNVWRNTAVTNLARNFIIYYLSQFTRVTDGQTDRRTDGQTDRITTRKTALAYARAENN